MNKQGVLFWIRSSIAFGLLLGSVAARAQTPAAPFTPSAQLSWEAFTEPIAIIETATPEPGRVAKVHVKRGSRVAKGDLLVELDSSLLEAQRRIAAQKAESTYQAESAQVRFQKLHERAETLLALSRDGGGTTRNEVRDAEAEARIAELAVVATAEEQLQMQLQLAEIDVRLEQRRIRSWIDGVVLELHRDPGEYVSSAEPLVVTVVDLSRLRATFYLPTAQTSRLSENTAVTLQFVATGQKVVGTVEYLAQVTLADSGRVRLDILIDNPTGELRSGVRCSLLLNEPTGLSLDRVSTSPANGQYRLMGRAQ